MTAKSNKMFMYAVIVLVAAFILLFLVFGKTDKSDRKEIITESTLEKIMDVSDLSTYEVVYNGIARVPNKKNKKKIDYYVAYNAKVKAGIDFEKVKISVDKKEKKIIVTVPEVEIMDSNVDITTLDYIFENKKAETKTVSQEAYKAAIKDVKKEIADKDAIYTLAAENAKNVIEALVNPFVKQMDGEYTLEIR